MIRLVSTGHRHGPLEGVQGYTLSAAEWPRPPRELRGNNGTEPLIQNWVAASNPLIPQLLYMAADVVALQAYFSDSSFAVLHVECADGKHRSVAAVETVGRILREWGHEVQIIHRDLDRGPE